MNLDTDFSSMRGSMGSDSGNTYTPVIGDNKVFDRSLFDWIACDEQFWFGADYYAKTLPDGGAWFVWDKAVDDGGDKMFGSSFELCWSKQKHKRQIVRLKWKGMFGVQEGDERKRVHPTQKPLALARWFLERFGGDGIVLDPFGGSGVVLIACEQTGRKCRAIELDTHYVDVILTRWSTLTGRDPVREDGVKWSSLNHS